MPKSGLASTQYKINEAIIVDIKNKYEKDFAQPHTSRPKWENLSNKEKAAYITFVMTNSDEEGTYKIPKISKLEEETSPSEEIINIAFITIAMSVFSAPINMGIAGLAYLIILLCSKWNINLGLSLKQAEYLGVAIFLTTSLLIGFFTAHKEYSEYRQNQKEKECYTAALTWLNTSPKSKKLKTRFHELSEEALDVDDYIKIQRQIDLLEEAEQLNTDGSRQTRIKELAQRIEDNMVKTMQNAITQQANELLSANKLPSVLRTEADEELEHINQLIELAKET